MIQPCRDHEDQPIIQDVCLKCAVEWKAERDKWKHEAMEISIYATGLCEALEWYAEWANQLRGPYHKHVKADQTLREDGGKRARNALAGGQKEDH
jgi:hypothetical protein